ncbi:class I SAM-dependent methyltransferase [Shimazuella sp. AN120528]|uniref:class I SAM-dependent methyltransferase n=1 Tax=Shimazuella soli TaxID=1892854 RepID=UPI001F0E4C1C|nr:class I SAM-dependent methyltransferase [Shimazuella soli]MCH5586396.1 class I SAM-dependent methyltransferase [Shimazuella soli]
MIVVTTSHEPSTKEKEKAVAIADSLSVLYVDRDRASLDKMYKQYEVDGVLIVTKQGLRYESSGYPSFFFHPNLSVVRLKQWSKGENDAMVRAANLLEGDQVLDCTLGMGADAIVSSFVTGASGRVVGLESEPLLACMVAEGLKNYCSGRPAVDEAMRRIEVMNCNYRSYLAKSRSNSFDVVVFDPMFRKTVYGSKAMQMLKPLANPTAVDEESVAHAVRVARRRVLLKERKNSSEFARLGFKVIHQSSSYAWGVIDP